MAATATFSWNSSTSANWTTSGDWSLTGGTGAFSTGSTANEYLFVLGAGGGTAYTVTVSSAITAGGISITSSNATLDVTSTLKAGAPATSAGGAGGGFSQSAGTVTLAGGTLQYVSYSISGGTFSGYGTIQATAAGSETLSTANGAAVTASSGSLLIEGRSTAGDALTVSTGTLFDIASTGVLDFGSYLTLSGTAGSTAPTVNFQGTSGTLEISNVYSPSTTAGLFSTTSSPFTLKATLENLKVGTTSGSDTGASVIDFQGITTAPTATTTKLVGNDIQIVENGSTYNIDTTTNLSGDYLNWAAVSGGYDFWIDTNPCYAEGTHILTERGEVAVEALAEGDRVVTLAGNRQELRPVKWIGHRRMNVRHHPKPDMVAPVRVRQHAFGVNVPSRDLVLSPDHCVFADDKLIPIKLLINDMTIVQERDTAAVHYFHVELDRHSVVLAEGLPAESYLDTGNRAYFANAGLAMVLHPEFAVNAGLKCWQVDACAPLAVSVPLVEPVWRELAERAAGLGYSRPDHATTDDPDLHLVADGRTIRPLSHDAGRYLFALPAGVSSLRMVSLAAVPSHDFAYLDDWRDLGVAISRIVFRGSDWEVQLPPDHPGFTQGWHQVERNEATMWRWMNGNAVLPVPAAQCPTMVEIHVGIATRYPVADAKETRLAA